MATRTETILLKLAGDATSGIRALDAIDKRLRRLLPSLEQVGKAGRALTVTFGAITAAGAKLIQSTAKVAMRNEVLGVALYTVGQTAGYTRQEMDALTDAIKAKGITTSNARQSIIRLIQAELDLNKATDLARTAQNLAGIAGENSSQAFQGITEAVTALQPRLLRKYGIVTTLNQALGDLADSTDVTAKRNRLLTYVLKEGEKMAGVYENMMGAVGKRITSIPRLLEEAQAALGKHFLPVIGLGVDLLSKLLKAFEALPEPVQRFLAMLVLGGTALSSVVAIVGALLAVLPFIVSGLSAVASALPVLLPILAAVGAAIGALVVAGKFFHQAWVEDWAGLRSAIESAWQRIQPLISGLVALIREWGQTFRTQIGAIWAQIRGLLFPIFERISALIRSIDWRDLFATFGDAVNTVGGYIEALLTTIYRLLQGQGLQAFLPLRDAMVNVLTLIALAWQKYISKALVWGYNLIVSAVNGILQAGRTVLVAALRSLGGIFARFLAASSPPREGPLSKIAEWGKGLIDTYLRAFETADFSILRDALAPIQDWLEMALSAGDIDEAGFARLFGSVREQVAQLIAAFRQTGEISEEVLGSIASALGEGSEELVKYLRLQLEYEQALNRLSAVQDEYDKAVKKGFVSKELKDRLAAAEDEADAAEDALDWQKAYLEATQETVDVQLRMAQALEDVADTLADADLGAGIGEAIAEGIGEGLSDLDLLGDVEEEPFWKRTRGLMGETAGGIGLMSGEFEEMRKKVEAFLALPLQDQLRGAARWLGEITGIDFLGFWERVEGVLQEIDQDGLMMVIMRWAGAALDYVAENWPKWAKLIGAGVLDAMGKALDLMASAAGRLGGEFIAWLGSIITSLLEWLQGEHASVGEALFHSIGAALGWLLNLLTVDLPRWIASLIRWLGDMIIGLLDWFKSEAPRTGTSLWTRFKLALVAWLEHMRENLPVWIANLIRWAGDLLQAFVAGFLEHAPEWLTDLVEVGSAIVDAIIGGLRENWWRLVDFFRQLLKDLRDLLPWSEPKDRTSPLYGLAASGEAIAANLSRGIDFSPVQSALTAELGRVQTQLSRGTAGLGPITIQQDFGDLSFPNVASGRDASGVVSGLDRTALEAGMMARTGGL